MNLRTNLILFFVLIAFSSCDKKRVFDEYKSVGSAWNKDSVVSFELPKLDPLKTYNLFVNLRSNDKYEFNNLFLIVSVQQPKGLTIVDTLEYKMADADGNMLGDGFSDIKESKLFYKGKVSFKPAGTYKVSIRQAVRRNGKVPGVGKLEGITDVGFRIESTP